MPRERPQLCLSGAGRGELPKAEVKPVLKFISHCAKFDKCQVYAWDSSGIKRACIPFLAHCDLNSFGWVLFLQDQKCLDES